MSSYKSCTAYALSQKILKSSAAGFKLAKARTVSSEYVMPCGLEYFGTHQIPLMDLSFSTYSFTTTISGPSCVISTLIISIPNNSVIAKCLSYPGTGHKNLTLSNLHHGVPPFTPKVIEREMVSYIIGKLALPQAITLSAETPIMSPINFFASGIPVNSP